MTLDLEPRTGPMRLGQDIVVCGPGLAVYAKLTSRALYALQCRNLLDTFNAHMTREGQRSLWKVIKHGNKFLKRHNLELLVSLTEEEIEAVRQGHSAPSGSLLLKV